MVTQQGRTIKLSIVLREASAVLLPVERISRSNTASRKVLLSGGSIFPDRKRPSRSVGREPRGKSGTLRTVRPAEHSDAKLTDLLHTLADCPKARSPSNPRPIARRGMSVIRSVEGERPTITIWRAGDDAEARLSQDARLRQPLDHPVWGRPEPCLCDRGSARGSAPLGSPLSDR